MPDTISCYQLQGKLGTGGMGTVYRAKDTRSGQTVAIKLLHPHLASDPEYVRRFKREARIARGLDSPNIVRVLDFGQDGETQYIVMEYVEGQTVGQLVQKQGPLPVDQAVSIATQVAAALDEAHKHRVVHRDIKPQNIIIAPNGLVKVTDFGVARVMGETTMTQHGTFMGTAPYMAPDHIFGGVDTRSDIYSLGIVLYQMLTGAVPFNADTPWATLELHKSASLPPLNGLRADARPWLVRITNRCLEKRPDRRFQTPGELMSALKAGDLAGQAENQETALLKTRGNGPGGPPPRHAPASTSDDGRKPPAPPARTGAWPEFRPSYYYAAGAVAAVVVAVVLAFVLLSGNSSGNDSYVVNPPSRTQTPIETTTPVPTVAASQTATVRTPTETPTLTAAPTATSVPCYMLSVLTQGGPLPTPYAIPLEPNCGSRWQAGTVVNLHGEALPDGWKFDGWVGSDDDGATDGSTTVTMNQDRAVSLLVAPVATPIPTPIPTPRPEDVNRDGRIDCLDYNLWLAAFRGDIQPPYTQNGSSFYPDINNDGVVDLLDFNIWLIAYQAGGDSTKC
jgi:serine/threonine protein kinase